MRKAPAIVKPGAEPGGTDYRIIQAELKTMLLEWQTMFAADKDMDTGDHLLEVYLCYGLMGRDGSARKLPAWEFARYLEDTYPDQVGAYAKRVSLAKVYKDAKYWLGLCLAEPDKRSHVVEPVTAEFQGVPVHMAGTRHTEYALNVLSYGVQLAYLLLHMDPKMPKRYAMEVKSRGPRTRNPALVDEVREGRQPESIGGAIGGGGCARCGTVGAEMGSCEGCGGHMCRGCHGKHASH